MPHKGLASKFMISACSDIYHSTSPFNLMGTRSNYRQRCGRTRWAARFATLYNWSTFSLLPEERRYSLYLCAYREVSDFLWDNILYSGKVIE